MTVLNFCQSFNPIIDKKSRVLILGSMPGPEALRKQQYYGFNGNHFWTILPAILGEQKPSEYRDKINLVRRHGIALWDVLKSCVRPGALDSAIRNMVCNPIPDLLKKYPNVRAVFINGRLAHKVFLDHFEGKVDRGVFRLPSTSPANAAMSMAEKMRQWSSLLKYLDSPHGSQVQSTS